MAKSKLPSLSIPDTAPDIVRGPGYQLSTDQPTQPTVAPSDEQPKKKTSVPPGFTKLGWAVREEYKKQLKVMAAQADRDAYELLDEAIRDYLTRRSQ
jgi:hypothetical protein